MILAAPRSNTYALWTLLTTYVRQDLTQRDYNDIDISNVRRVAYWNMLNYDRIQIRTVAYIICYPFHVLVLLINSDPAYSISRKQQKLPDFNIPL